MTGLHPPSNIPNPVVTAASGPKRAIAADDVILKTAKHYADKQQSAHYHTDTATRLFELAGCEPPPMGSDGYMFAPSELGHLYDSWKRLDDERKNPPQSKPTGRMILDRLAIHADNPIGITSITHQEIAELSAYVAQLEAYANEQVDAARKGDE